MELKFSKEGLKLFEDIKGIGDIQRLRSIKDAILTAEKVNDLKSVIKTK